MTATLPSSIPFLLFACQQPIERLEYLRPMGLNCVVDIDQTQGADPLKFAAWVAETRNRGLYRIHAPRDPNAAEASNQADARDPLFLGWSFMDEPELHSLQPADLLAKRAPFETYGKPWFGNFDGSQISGLQVKPTTPTPAVYQQLVALCDIVSEDVYPVSGWGLSIPLDSHVLCQQSLLSYAGPVRPRMAYVETCFQNLSWLPGGGRAPTAAEFDAQMAMLASSYLPMGLNGIGFYAARQQGAGMAYSSWAVAADVQAQISLWCRHLLGKSICVS